MKTENLTLEDCLHFLMATAQNKVAAAYKARLSEIDVTPSQAGVLSCLKENGSMTQKQIADKMYLEGSTVSGILERMEKKELVERIPNPENRREVQVEMTSKAKALFDQVRMATLDLHQAVLSGFPEAEQDMFQTMLRTIIATPF